MEQEEIHFDREVDASGLIFPLPIWKEENVLSQMAVGQVLKLNATGCCGIVKNMRSFADQTGHILLSNAQVNGSYIFYMEKGNCSNNDHI